MSEYPENTTRTDHEYPDEVTRTDHFESYPIVQIDQDESNLCKKDEMFFARATGVIRPFTVEEEKRMAILEKQSVDTDKPIVLMMKEAAELHEFAEQVAQGAMERIVRIVGSRGELSSPVETEDEPTLPEDLSLITELQEEHFLGIRNSLKKIQMAINSL